MALSPNLNVSLTTSASKPSTDTVLFDATVDGGNITTFSVENLSSSAGYAFVQVTPLHPAGYYAPIAAGEKEVFRCGNLDSISKVTAYAASTATVDTKINAKVYLVGQDGW